MACCWACSCRSNRCSSFIPGLRSIWLFKPFLALVDYLSVDPTSPMGMKHIVRLVEAGRPVVVFPEGRITVTGSLMKIYDGPAFIAAKTGATILPVHLDGPARSYFSRLGSAYPRRWFPKMRITIMPVKPLRCRRRAIRVIGATRPAKPCGVYYSMLFASRPVGSLFEGA